MDLEVPFLLILNGSQGMGKSHCAKYIMYKLRKKFDFGIVFTNTFFDDNPFGYLPEKYIHPEYNEKVLENLMDKQAKLVEKEL